MSIRPKLVAGNWKMHGNLAANASLLHACAAGFKASEKARCAVCVPAPYLAQTQSLLTGSAVLWGAQNVSEHAQGAYTGEVSATMVREFGCHFVIAGHSERRALYGESDEVVAAKVAAILAAGLTPILCVGESLAEREGGQSFAVVSRQLAAVVSRVGIEAFAGIVVAYEPVWAIGTGRTATPEQAQEVHLAIRSQLRAVSATIADNVQILYGGSVKASNAKDIFAMPDVDGGLIGGASLVAEDFLAICAAAG